MNMEWVQKNGEIPERKPEMIRQEWLFLPKPKAILFDMDGVIFDTQKAKNQAAAMAINTLFGDRLTLRVTEKEIFENYNGMGISDFGKELLNQHNVNATPEEIDIIRKQRDVELQKLIDRRLAAISGTLQFIKYAHSKNIPLAIASGSKREFILQVIQSLGIKDYFPVIVSRYEVEHGKPAPDVYLKAAKQLGMDPKYCYVTEDAQEGMKAGNAAGCKVIGLVPNVTQTYSANWLVNSLTQIEFEDK